MAERLTLTQEADGSNPSPTAIKYKKDVTMEIKSGDKVKKRSLRPFKSGKRVNTVKDIVTNPYTGKVAYTFIEDDSIVDAYQCIKE